MKKPHMRKLLKKNTYLVIEIKQFLVTEFHKNFLQAPIKKRKEGREKERKNLVLYSLHCISFLSASLRICHIILWWFKKGKKPKNTWSTQPHCYKDSKNTFNNTPL